MQFKHDYMQAGLQ